MGRRKQSNPARNATAGEASAPPAQPAPPPAAQDESAQASELHPLEDEDWDLVRSAQAHAREAGGASFFAPPKKRGKKADEVTSTLACACGERHPDAQCEPFPVAVVPLVDTAVEADRDLSGCDVVLRLINGGKNFMPWWKCQDGVRDPAHMVCELVSADQQVLCKVCLPSPPPYTPRPLPPPSMPCFPNSSRRAPVTHPCASP